MCVCVCTIVRACILAQRRNAAGFLGGLNTLLHRAAMEGQAASACAAPSGSEADRETHHRHTGVPAGFVLPGELPDDNTAKVLKQNQALLKLVEGLSDRVMRLESREQGKGPKAGPKGGCYKCGGDHYESVCPDEDHQPSTLQLGKLDKIKEVNRELSAENRILKEQAQALRKEIAFPSGGTQGEITNLQDLNHKLSVKCDFLCRKNIALIEEVRSLTHKLEQLENLWPEKQPPEVTASSVRPPPEARAPDMSIMAVDMLQNTAIWAPQIQRWAPRRWWAVTESPEGMGNRLGIYFTQQDSLEEHLDVSPRGDDNGYTVDGFPTMEDCVACWLNSGYSLLAPLRSVP